MNTQRFTSQQRKFLHDLATTTQPLKQTLNDHRIDAQVLAGWLRRKPFRKRVREILSVMSDLRALLLQSSARHALGVLENLADNAESTAEKCKACQILLDQAQQQPRVVRVERKGKANAASTQESQEDYNDPRTKALVDELVIERYQELMAERKKVPAEQ